MKQVKFAGENCPSALLFVLQLSWFLLSVMVQVFSVCFYNDSWMLAGSLSNVDLFASRLYDGISFLFVVQQLWVKYRLPFLIFYFFSPWAASVNARVHMSVPGTSWYCCFCKTSPQFTFLGLTHQAQARFPSFPEETKKNKVLTSSSCSVSESTTSNVHFHLRQKKTEILAISEEPDLWMLHVYVYGCSVSVSLYMYAGTSPVYVLWAIVPP